MPLTWRILLALVCGLGAGMLVASLDPGASSAIMTIAEPIAAVWLDGLRMTIIPLVFGLVVNGIASASDAASAGAVARKALLLFALLLTLAGLLAAFATPALLALWPISGDTAAAFAGFAHPAGPPQAIPPASEWVKQIVPANPIAAAAEGAMLPIVLFAVVFGFAATRIAGEARERICGLFDAIVQVMLVIVHWVLLLAPIGVFALALLVTARAGASVVGGLAHYVVIISILCVSTIAAMYAIIAWFSRVSVKSFAKAAWPAQAIAFSTQSSLASLPAMVEGSRRQLRVPTHVSDLVLPLAVSLFRITSPAANLGVALYLAHMNGLHPSVFQIGAGVVVAAVVSLASVGLPSQVSFFSVVAPVCIVVGAPVEPLALLLAVETIPDIFRTVGNVTADVAATALVGAPATDDDLPEPSDARA
ncbi:MAG TPA: cation:dicarboxylase symporter family transporter [Bauldia sp.]|nr:cation:dicarboxylase symporter family transporter [Bauldia sp.]